MEGETIAGRNDYKAVCDRSVVFCVFFGENPAINRACLFV